MSDRQGIEIDYCPSCRGVWLDRGELDKIIERAALQAASPVVPGVVAPSAPQPPVAPHTWNEPQRPPQQTYPQNDYARNDYRRDNDYRHENDYHYRKKKKRGGFLEDLFDFD
jgi:Zn-finger nucleic acid-binding protein